MTISQEVKDWHERSEALAAEIDAHLNSYPGPERSRINSSENVVIYLGNRYTLITGFVPPEIISGNLKIGKGKP